MLTRHWCTDDKLNLDYVKENIMRRFAFVLAAAMIAFVCCSCSSTKIIQKNKFEIHESKEKVIAVYANFSNYRTDRSELREQIETEVQSQFLKKDIKSYKTAGCFKNKESSSNSEYQEFLSDNNIDWVCEIIIPSAGLMKNNGMFELNIKYDVKIFDPKSEVVIFNGIFRVKTKAERYVMLKANRIFAEKLAEQF